MERVVRCAGEGCEQLFDAFKPVGGKNSAGMYALTVDYADYLYCLRTSLILILIVSIAVCLYYIYNKRKRGQDGATVSSNDSQ